MKRSRSPHSEDKVGHKPPTRREVEVTTADTTPTTHSSQQHVPAELQDLYQIAMGNTTSTSSDRYPQYPFTVTPSTIDAALESLQRFEKRGSAQAEPGITSDVKTEQGTYNNDNVPSHVSQQQRRYLFTQGLPRAQFVIQDDQLREEIAAVTGEFMRRRFLQLYNEVTANK